MYVLRIFMAMVLAVFSVAAAHAVVVDISQISEGTPAPGTTISLETPEGEAIDLEVELVDLGELVETGTPEAGEPQVPSETAQPSETTPQTEIAETPAEEPSTERRTVTALAVPEDGQVRFEVEDRHRNRPLVLVIRDGSGTVLERRSITLTGALVTVAVSSLPAIGLPGTPAASLPDPSASASVANADAVSPVDRMTPENVVQYRFHIGSEFEGGWMERSSFNALRLQTGGAVVEDRFASVDQDGSFYSIKFDGEVDLGVPAPFGNGNLYATGSFRYGTSSADSYGTNVSTGGRDLAILAPEGPGGTLGGGAVVGAAFSDLDFVSFDNRYDEYMVQAGLSTLITQGPWTVTPRGLLFYGRTDESLDYDGRTNAGTLDFAYDVKTDSNRFGAQIGTEVAVNFHEGVAFFVAADARLVHNSADSTASLNLSGALNHSETVTASNDQFDVGGILEGGVRFRQGRFSADIGGRFETWQVPVARITGERPLYIDYESRDSYSAFARVNIALGGPVVRDTGPGFYQAPQ